MEYGEDDAVIFTRRVQDGPKQTDGSVHRTCMGPNYGCRKLVWASPFSVKRETEIKATGGSVHYMCMQCAESAIPANIAAAKAAGREVALGEPTPAEWAAVEKNLSPFERVKLRLLYRALFGHLPPTGD